MNHEPKIRKIFQNEFNQLPKKIVSIYSIVNRINWLSEIGIQFNQNPSSEIEGDKLKKWKNSVDILLA